MTGGNQLLLSATLGGTPVAQLIRRLNAKGCQCSRDFGRCSVYIWFYDRRWSSRPYPRCNMVNLAWFRFNK